MRRVYKEKSRLFSGRLHIIDTSSGSVFKTKVSIAADSFGAEDEARTRDPNLGKVVLYQLSYFRRFPFFSFGIAKVGIFLLPPNFFATFFEKMSFFLENRPKIASKAPELPKKSAERLLFFVKMLRARRRKLSLNFVSLSLTL